MKKKIIAAAFIVVAFTSTGWAEEIDAENQDLDNKTICKQYAEEDGVSEEKMSKYMALCIEEMNSNDSADEEVVYDDGKPEG